MNEFAIDASFALKWCFADETTTFTELALKALLNGSVKAVTTAIFATEVANITLVGERRKRITQSEAQVFLELMRKLPIASVPRPLTVTLGRVLDLARQHSLTAYDAAYLDLALEESLPLATFDAALQRACASAGVRLLTEGDLAHGS